MLEKPISKAAREITGLELHDSILTYNGTVVKSVSIKTGLEGFLAFLQPFEKVILVGHNVKKFDTPTACRTGRIKIHRDRPALR